MSTILAKVLRFGWDSGNNMKSPTVGVAKPKNGCSRVNGEVLTNEVLTKSRERGDHHGG
jgi:hypothetical protein